MRIRIIIVLSLVFALAVASAVLAVPAQYIAPRLSSLGDSSRLLALITSGLAISSLIIVIVSRYRRR